MTCADYYDSPADFKEKISPFIFSGRAPNLNVLKKIPYGATKTYSEIASELETFSCGLDKKNKLLELEKIIFDEKGRVAHDE